MYFLAFLGNVNCRISGAAGGFAPWTPISILPWNHWRGGSKHPPDLQLLGTMTVGHWMSCLRHNIHTLCDLQTMDSGKSILTLMGKVRGKWVEIIKNSVILYEPWDKLSNLIRSKKKSFMASLNEEKLPFLTDNLASASSNVGEELYSWSFLVDIIDLIIVSSIKDIKIIENTCHNFSWICSVLTSFVRLRVVWKGTQIQKIYVCPFCVPIMDHKL